jgi:hypothetical protein
LLFLLGVAWIVPEILPQQEVMSTDPLARAEGIRLWALHGFENKL